MIVPARFNAATLEAAIDDMAHDRYGKNLRRVIITDESQPGLRAHVSKTGAVFIVDYYIGDSRPAWTIGYYPQTSIAEARELAATVLALAEMGIDVQKGLKDRLFAELKRDGIAWRPNLAPEPKGRKT